MGYWNAEPNGTSFSDSERMLWGDSPADAMADGMDGAIIAFTRDLGRLPTEAEVIGGMLFHLPSLSLPVEPIPAEGWGSYNGGDYDQATERAKALLKSVQISDLDVEQSALRDEATAKALREAADSLDARAASFRKGV